MATSNAELTSHEPDRTHEDMWLSVLVVAELWRGAALLRRSDATAAESLESWLLELELAYADRVLPITNDVARRWATLGIPDPLPVVDGLLAATAPSDTSNDSATRYRGRSEDRASSTASRRNSSV